MASEARATPDPDDFGVDDAVVRALVLDYLVHNGARTWPSLACMAVNRR